MSFKSVLYNIANDLSQRHSSRNSVMERCITDRLDKALRSYEKSLSDSVTLLDKRDSLDNLRRLSK